MAGPRVPPHVTRPQRFRRGIAIGIAVGLTLFMLLLGSFPWGVLRPQVEAALSRRFGANVAIGRVERTQIFSYRPTLIVHDMAIAQPSWAGRGALLHVGRVDIRFNVLPVLIGRFDLQALAIEDARANLVRLADGRKNWAPENRGGSGSAAGFDRLTVRNLVVDLKDAKAGRSFTVTIASDDSGFSARGTGRIDEAPVRVDFTGPAIGERTRWPFAARVTGPTIDFAARGTMARPLDTRTMQADVTARADDLKTLDALVEAGLFGTQPVRLNARVAHAGDDWTIERMAGTIGRSRLRSAAATVRKRDGRTVVDGDLHFATLGFDDLQNAEGRAQAAALEARIGPRVIPDTRINLSKMDRTDGTVRVRADRLLTGSDSALRSLRATLTLDRQRLRVAPLAIALSKGRIGGSVVVDNRDRTSPRVTFDLKLTDSSIATFGAGGRIDAPLEGVLRLSGTGDTIRSAIGRSNGSIGLAARNGQLPAKLASILGADVARGILSDADATATLRCLAVRVAVTRGQGRFAPLLVDTSRAQTRGTGTIDFPAERLALSLTGTPKQRTLLRLDRPVAVTGTLSSPDVRIPPGVKSAGGILRMIGRAIEGDQGPRAGNADCGAVTARALR